MSKAIFVSINKSVFVCHFILYLVKVENRRKYPLIFFFVIALYDGHVFKRHQYQFRWAFWFRLCGDLNYHIYLKREKYAILSYSRPQQRKNKIPREVVWISSKKIKERHCIYWDKTKNTGVFNYLMRKGLFAIL